jgi:hypothetical protein
VRARECGCESDCGCVWVRVCVVVWFLCICGGVCGVVCVGVFV